MKNENLTINSDGYELLKVEPTHLIEFLFYLQEGYLEINFNENNILHEPRICVFCKSNKCIGVDDCGKRRLINLWPSNKRINNSSFLKWNYIEEIILLVKYYFKSLI